MVNNLIKLTQVYNKLVLLLGWWFTWVVVILFMVGRSGNNALWYSDDCADCRSDDGGGLQWRAVDLLRLPETNPICGGDGDIVCLSLTESGVFKLE